MHRTLLLAASIFTALAITPAESAEAPLVPVGFARVDVTPETPVRLGGYGNRREESEGVAQKLHARAIAIGDSVLVAVDSIGLPAAIVEEVAARLKKSHNLPRERLAVCATHSHTAPYVNGVVPLIFGEPIPTAHQANLDRYAAFLTDRIAKAAAEALADRKPARLSWAEGKVGFAMNRRVIENRLWVKFGENTAGPVDHSLPVLIAKSPDGTLRGVVANYACHCTTFTGPDNRIHGDWAGVAAEILEGKHPGAVALITIGCGGDANPSPRIAPLIEQARIHGQTLASEVERFLDSGKPLSAPPVCKLERFDLPLAPIPPKEEWERRAEGKNRPAFFAKLMLERLSRGEKVPTTVPYSAQAWTFGNDLAMVFLAGEVVVDYSLRLKKELDGKRLWVTAYANDLPCYIASKRMAAEGGYEVEQSMYSYDRAAPLAPEVEDLIITRVRGMVPQSFVSASRPALPGALSPAESLATLRTRPGFQVELVAAEPLVQDPVDIAWGPDGRMWVVEMADYPLGIDGKGKPGGRVRVIADTDGDGKYDRSDLFLDGLPFPSGVMPWRKGVLITAAPSLLYAEDTNGDGKADVVTPLFSGFIEGNQQHRVNGPRWGLDGWVYLANGDSDGKIRSVKTGAEIDIRGRDLRVNPDTGAMEALTGRAQFGRNRDDWGRWFGCNNSRPLWHYVLDDQDLRRNPYLLPPKPIVEVPEVPGAAPVFPASRTVARFNDVDRANRFTSACGTNLYRDDLLNGLNGNAFIAEPVHNLVSRLVLTPEGVSFVGKRAPGEERAEFLASTDGWFRPTAVHTGPDGALYVVDMYRQVIEHPQWIPADWQKELDLRAGHDRGRIYRIVPTKAERRAVERLDTFDTKKLVAALDSPNGWQRDTAQQLLTWTADRDAAEPLRKLARSSERPLARLQSLCTLDTVGVLEAEDVVRALADSHPEIRRQGVRVARKFAASPTVTAKLLTLLDDPAPGVRLELAAALGEFPPETAGPAIAALFAKPGLDEYTLASGLSSITAKNIDFALTAALGMKEWPAAEGLFRMAAILGEAGTVTRAAEAIGPPSGDSAPSWKLAALAGLLDGLDARQQGARPQLAQVDAWLARARTVAAREEATEAERIAAVRLLTRKGDAGIPEVPLFLALLGPRNPPAVQEQALASIVRVGSADAADRLVAGWKTYGPKLRPRVAETLVAREAWAERLLGAIEAGKIPAGQVDAAARQRLLRSRNVLRERAEKLFAGGNSDRVKLVEQYLASLPKSGDVERGRAVFLKNCAACHRVQDQGHAVGPDLAMMTDKPADWFLTAILDPNRAVEDRYAEYLAVTEDGRSFTGVLTSETGVAVTLKGPEGKEQTLSRRDLETLSASGRSPMPDGLEREITPPMMADLFAYLATLRPPGAPAP